MAEFKKQFFGYDVAQVEKVISSLDEKIVQLDSDLQNSTKINQEKDEEINRLKAELETYKENEDAIKLALISAKKVATEMVGSAQAESGDLMADAKNRSEDMLRKAEETQNEKLRETEKNVQEIISKSDEQLQEIRIEYSSWVVRQKEAVEKFRAMLEAQLNLLTEDQYRIDNYGLPDVSKLDKSLTDSELEKE